MCTKKCCSWPRNDHDCKVGTGWHRFSRGVSRTPTAAKFQHSLTLVNYFQQLTYVT